MRFSPPLLLLSVLFALTTAVGAETRVALVVGNGAYEQEIAALKNPVSDATAVAAALPRLDFDHRGNGPRRRRLLRQDRRI